MPETNQSITTDWGGICASLKLGGLVRELTTHMVLKERKENVLQLILEDTHARLLNKEREAELVAALSDHFGEPMKIRIEIGQPGEETPAQARVREKDERMQQAIEAIETDPNVQQLKEQFGARVNAASIRPKA